MAEDKNITQLEKVSQVKDDALIYGVQDSRDVAIPANLLKADYFVTTGLTALTELSTSQQIAKAIGSFEGLKNAINATIPVFEETADKDMVIFEYGSVSDENANEIIELVFYYYKDFHKIRIKKSVSGTLSLERLKTGLLNENNITNDEEDTGENKVPGLPLVKNISVKEKANADAIVKINRSNVVYLQGNITSNTAIGKGNLGDKWYITDTKEIIEITSFGNMGAVITTNYAPYPDSLFIYKDNLNEIYIFSPEEGMKKNTLSIGEEDNTAYEGSKGKANADAIIKINRSNTVYLQGNTTSDILISGGNLHDKWYLTDTKKIREIVGFTKPLERPITEDYAPIDNSIYIYKNDPGKLYIFSTIFGGMVVISRGDYSTEYLEGQTLENIIASLKDEDGLWKYGIKFPWQLNAQKFLDNFDFGTVEVIPYGDSDYADDIVQFTVEIINDGISAFLQFVIPADLSGNNELNNWHNYRLLTFSKPCGPINYTQFKKFTGNFGLDGFQLFSIMQGSEWVYSPTPEEIKDNELAGVYSYGGLIKVIFRDGNGMDWYNLHFYSGNNYHETLPDASLNSEDWSLSVNPSFEDMFLAALKGAAEITDDTGFIGKTGNDEYSVFYVTEIVEAGEGIQDSFYTPTVSNGNITFSRKESIYKANISSDTTFSVTVENTNCDFPKNLIINQTLVSQMTFPDNIVWLETPDFSQPGVYHVEFKICVQDPTKLLALVTFKEPVL